MVESPKESGSSCKNKSSLPYEDIGKDFFGSWKSVLVAEDDAMDFTSPSLSKGSKAKKSNFNFDKLNFSEKTISRGLYLRISDLFRDMDFALIVFSEVITNMVDKMASFKEDGDFWFTDLTTPDPLYILHVVIALTLLWEMIERQCLKGCLI